ncbi:MAG: alpha-hydroxy acid oxidase [Gammaproteobacteria bacterium]
MPFDAQQYLNIQDLRQRARSLLPAPVLGYLEGGADDEYTLTRNIEAFRDYELMPRYLVDISSVDTRTRVFGVDVDLPLLLSPTGFSRMFHPDAEIAAARAAAAHGTMYTLSTVATESIESVAAACSGPKMFQVYVLKDPGLNYEFIQRCRDANYDALCLTVDVPAGGNRERDLRTGMVMPPTFGWRSKLSFATHPSWALGQMRGPAFDVPNVSSRVSGYQAGLGEQMNYLFSQFDPTVAWPDAEKMIDAWGGPFAIKGIMSPGDARRAVEVGATAVIVSNHGGRQLDTVPATIDCLKAIVDEVGGEAEVIIDGGIRRGTDVLKALALGANACMIGRPYVYGLASGGEAGVGRVLDIFKAEIARDLALLGCNGPGEVGRDYISHRA